MWHPAMNRWHDQTGIAHYLVNDKGTAKALCGARPYSFGGGFTAAKDSGSHACEKCEKSIKNGGHIRYLL